MKPFVSLKKRTSKKNTQNATLLLAAITILIIEFSSSSCQKRGDDAILYQPLLLAHQWVLDSSNVQTFASGSSAGVTTKTKGDSSITLTYHQNTFDERNHQSTRTRNYQLDGLKVYYWDIGTVTDYSTFKTIIDVNDNSLSEQIIVNGQNGSTTNTFNFYHAR